MSWLFRWARRARLLARRADVERAMDEEMRHHLECETAERVARGDAPEEARRAALRAFGGVERHKEDARDARGVRSLEDLAQDVRYAARVLRRAPTFTATAVLTLALGIGAAAAIFSVVYGVLLRPLPYAHADRLVVLWERNVARGSDRNVVSVPNFEAWRDGLRDVEAVGAIVPRPTTVTGAGDAERVPAAQVTPGWFAMLGVAPALGREFAAREGDDAAVVMLADGYWRRRFGADPAVVGRALHVDGRAFTIVGVMPRGFEPPRFGWLGEQELWFPFGATEGNRTWGRFLLVVARRRDGVPLARLDAALAALADRRADEAAANQGWSAAAVPLAEQITGDVRRPLLVLLGAVAVLLLMAVVNVGTLVTAHTRRRAHEMAVRHALGASRGRLARQVLTESALLGAAGAVAGALAVAAGVRLLVRLLPADLPRAAAVRLDGPVLLAVVLVSVLVTLGVGIVAARHGTRTAEPTRAFRSAGRGSARARGGSLVVAEFALALLLALAGALVLRTFARLRAVDLGFRAEQVVMGRVALSGPRWESPERRHAFWEALAARLRATPGVRAGGLVSGRPLGGNGPATSVGDAARPAPTSAEPTITDVRWADAGYFEAMRIRRIAGPGFDGRERPGDPPRVVISRGAARLLWGADDAIGRRVRVTLNDGIVAEVVGVVDDVHLTDARTAPRPTVYFAATQREAEANDVVLRGDVDPAVLHDALRAVVAALDPALPVFAATTLEAMVATTLARDRAATTLLGAFAALGLLLAGVGIYGVFAGDVARRRVEIGIRMALGARSHGVLALVLARAVCWAAAGLLLGGIGALVLGRAMEPMLFGVRAFDPVSFAAVALLLLVVAVLATLVPALRAARVSPVEAMRAG